MGISIQDQMWISGLGFLAALGIILPMVRRDYLRHGRLSYPGAILQLVAWFAFHVFLALVVWGDLWPSAHAYIPRNWIGGLFALPGLGLCLAGMGVFRSLKVIFGREANRLVVSGVYRWTRNPQYTGYGLILLGVVLSYWSATAWLVLPAYALLVCLTVRIEEEHLEAVFGEQYRAYCRQAPRFIGMRGQEKGSK
jgi:protein-S-isoprenylcysteine O-methyltransferase Ste14